MTPSLILALVAAFFTVPLVALHSLAAWQYNKVTGFGRQKAILHTSCTYILRLTVAIWLAASVAGLVVVSQQASCLPGDVDGGFWKSGVSCTLQRTVVIVSVVSFVTICIFFCSRELCDRPYDISLLGVYKQHQTTRDESIFSNTSWDSENTLKNDVLCLCRHSDATPGPYWLSSNGNIEETPTYKPSVKHPMPMHPTPLLTIDTDRGSECALSPSETLNTDPYPVSRSSTLLISPTLNRPQAPGRVAELPATPELQAMSPKHTHKRAKSSLSSLKKYIPKSFPISLPLSADPQIRELSDPNLRRDHERQPPKGLNLQKVNSQVQPASGVQPPASSSTTPTQTSDNRRRSATVSSADAPEVLTPETEPPVPSIPSPHTQSQPQIQRTSISLHHPHRPNYTPYPRSQFSVPNPPPIHRALNSHPPTELRRQPTRRRQSLVYSFEPPQNLPRHTQSQHHPHYYNRRRIEPSRNFSYSHRTRRNDVEIIYPSTRPARSSTYGGGMGSGGRLDSIKEVSRGSIHEGAVLGTSYRGADRTSLCEG
ncbi:hypothetical protein PHISCL_05366 [Aspergillus sclerotialis]|uniref:Uncharacterized protein n=1 Tax=Aspergillus sclerotialis TaxID=2070753 RepID=A0A3A2ZSJ8_9EURO|nr:hypothetical protein PHISCL_05366 [Aspergillus sclerotialis]